MPGGESRDANIVVILGPGLWIVNSGYWEFHQLRT